MGVGFASGPSLKRLMAIQVPRVAAEEEPAVLVDECEQIGFVPIETMVVEQCLHVRWREANVVPMGGADKIAESVPVIGVHSLFVGEGDEPVEYLLGLGRDCRWH